MEARLTEYEWILSSDTGASSKTIFAVMVGAKSGEYLGSTPSDPSDFGRCYRLIGHFPEWRSRLGEVVERYPHWKPIVDNWEKLSMIYERDVASGESSELYLMIQKIMKDYYNKQSNSKPMFEVGDHLKIESISGNNEYELVTITEKTFTGKGWFYNYDIDDGTGDGYAHESSFVRRN